MKKIFLNTLFLIAALALFGTDSSDLSSVRQEKAETTAKVVIIENGIFLPAIVMPPDSDGRLKLAVEELASCIREITGKPPRIVSGKVEGPALYIGNSDEAKKAGLDGTKMPIEGFRIKTVGNCIYLVGNDKLISTYDKARFTNSRHDIRSFGSTWAVYDFLERVLGVRYYWQTPEGGRCVPGIKNLAIDPVNYSDAPVFLKREIFPHNKGNGTWPLHAALRSNDAHEIQLRVHDPRWLPDYKPGELDEIFQLQSNGLRRTSHMLCYGNPRTLQEYLKRIDEELAGGRDSRLILGSAVTVSPWDLDVNCRCEYCVPLMDYSSGNTGSASKLMCRFVLNLANKLKKRHPELKIIYLPYMNYVRLPDGVTFPDNVEIQLASKVGLAMHKQPMVCAEEQAILDAWRKACGNRRIQEWQYSCWPASSTSAPFVYADTIIGFYNRNRNKITGSFINGEINHWPQSNVSLYIWMKALWNPEISAEKIMDGMCLRLYGAAAKQMREIYQIQKDGWEKKLWQSNVITSKFIFETSYPRKSVLRMEQLFTEAEALAKDDPAALKRIAFYKSGFLAFFADSRDYAEGRGKNTLQMRKTAENPNIDGKIDEATWKLAPEVPFVRALDRTNKQPKYPTTVQALWTPDGVTFGFRMVEPEPDKLEITKGGKDTRNLWWNDNIEVFLDVTGKNEGDYYQFIFTASNGAIFDAHRNNPAWDAQGIKYKAYRGKDFWSMEVYIPYSAFSDNNDAMIPTTQALGIKWLGNFTRHRTSVDEKDNEYTRMNTTYASFSNNGSDFGELQFKE